MGCITFETMQELISVNFSFPDYEHFLNLGMVYYYCGEEYVIGGFNSDEFTETDKKIAKEGCWLPDSMQLLEWLELVGFDVVIRFDASDRYFRVEATDCVNNAQYNAGGPVLAFALAKSIYKICKSKRRPYIPPAVERVQIDF